MPPGIIEAKGAVSPEVALALADGIRKVTGARLGIGVTGIAGPGGGTPEKPVGLVYIGIADEHGPRQKEFRFLGDRDRIRLVRFASSARYGSPLFSSPLRPGASRVRLFVALDLPDAVRQKLRELIDD